MPEKRLPIPLTLTHFQSKRERLSSLIEQERKSGDIPDNVGKLDSLNRQRTILTRRIQAFQQSPTLMAFQNDIPKLIEGRKVGEISREEYGEVVKHYNDQVRAVISQVEIPPPLTVRRSLIVQPTKPADAHSQSTAEMSFKEKPLSRLKIEVEEIEKRIVELLPESHLEIIYRAHEQNVGKISSDVQALAQLIFHSQQDNLKFPTSDEQMIRNPENMFSLVITAFRGTLAERIMPGGVLKKETKALDAEVAEVIKNNSYLLEHKGAETVSKALQEMSLVEQIIIFRYMSPELKERLGYPDLEYCTGEEMAKYITLAASHIGEYHEFVFQEASETALIELLKYSLDREENPTTPHFAEEVIGYLLKDSDAKETIRTILTIARDEDALFTAEQFFIKHEQTRRSARRARYGL